MLWEDGELGVELECVDTEESELRLELLGGGIGGIESGAKTSESGRTDSNLAAECLEDSDWAAECLEDSDLAAECLEDSGFTKDSLEDSDLTTECLEEPLFATEPLPDSVFGAERADMDLVMEPLGSDGRDFS